MALSPYYKPDPDATRLWEEYGAFYRNSMTGQMVLKNNYGGLPGINRDNDIYLSPEDANNYNHESFEDDKNWAHRAFAPIYALVQGTNLFTTPVFQGLKIYNKAVGDREDSDFYDLWLNEFHQIQAGQTFKFGVDNSGGAYVEEFAADLHRAVTKLDAGALVEAIVGAPLAGLAGFTDMYITSQTFGIPLASGAKWLSRGVGALSKSPRAMSAISSLGAGNVLPNIQKVATAAHAKRIAAAVGFGTREMIDVEDSLTDNGMGIGAALPWAVSAGIATTGLEYLGGPFIEKYYKGELAGLKDYILEGVTESAQSLSTNVLSATGRYVHGDRDAFNEWQNWLDESLKEGLGVLPVVGISNGITKLRPGANRGVDRALDFIEDWGKNGILGSKVAITLEEMKEKDPRRYRKFQEHTPELLASLAGTSDPDEKLRRYHMSMAYNWARKYRDVKEVQTAYKFLLESSIGSDATNAANTRNSASAEAEAAGARSTLREPAPGIELTDLLVDVTRTLNTTITSDTATPSDVTGAVRGVLDMLHVFAEKAPLLEVPALEAVRNVSMGLLNPQILRSVTGAQRSALSSAFTRFINATPLLNQDQKVAEHKAFHHKLSQNKRIALAELNREETRDKVEYAWEVFKNQIDNIAKSEKADAAKKVADLELAILNHQTQLHLAGVGYITDLERGRYVKHQMQEIDEMLSSGVETLGIESTAWLLRAYSYLSGYQNNPELPSIARGIVSPKVVQNITDNIAAIGSRAHREFLLDMQAAQDLDNLVSTILRDNARAFEQGLPAEAQPHAIESLQNQELLERSARFVSRVGSPAVAESWMTRVAAARSAAAGTLLLGKDNAPMVKLLAELQPYGATSNDVFKYIKGVWDKNFISKMLSKGDTEAERSVRAILDGNDPLIPLKDRIDYSTVERGMAKTIYNEVLTGIRGLSDGLQKLGQDAAGPLLPFDQDTGKTTAKVPSMAGTIFEFHRRYWAEKIIEEKLLEIVDTQADEDTKFGHTDLTKMGQKITDWLASTAANISARRAIDGRRKYKDNSTDPRKWYEIPVESEMAEAIGIFSVIVEETMDDALLNRWGMEKIREDIKRKMVEVGAARVRRGENEKNFGTPGESAMLFARFMELRPELTLPYLKRAADSLNNKKSGMSQLEQGNKELLVEALRDIYTKVSAINEDKRKAAEDPWAPDTGELDNIKLDRAKKDALGKVRDLYNGSELMLYGAEGLEIGLVQILMEAQQRIQKKNQLLGITTNRYSYEDLFGSGNTQGAVGEVLDERLAKADTSRLPASPEMVLQLVAAGYLDQLAKRTADATPSKQRMIDEITRDFQAKMLEKKQHLQERVDAGDFEGGDTDPMVEQLEEQIENELYNEYQTALDAIATTDAPDVVLTQTPEFYKAVEVYALAQAAYHKDRARGNRSLSPQMTHTFGRNTLLVNRGAPNEKRILSLETELNHDDWNRGIDAMVALRLSAVNPDLYSKAVDYGDQLQQEIMPRIISKSPGRPPVVTTNGLNAAYWAQQYFSSQLFLLLPRNRIYDVDDLNVTKYNDRLSGGIEATAVQRAGALKARAFVHRLLGAAYAADGITSGKGVELKGQITELLDNLGGLGNWRPSKSAKLASDFAAEIARILPSDVPDGVRLKGMTPLRYIQAARSQNILVRDSKFKKIYDIANAYAASRTEDLAIAKRFYDVLAQTGVHDWRKRINGKEIGEILGNFLLTGNDVTHMNEEESYAFNYVSKHLLETSKAIRSGGTHYALIGSLTRAGLRPDEIALNLSIISHMANVWAKKNKKSPADFIAQASGLVLVNKSQDAAYNRGLFYIGTVHVPIIRQENSEFYSGKTYRKDDKNNFTIPVISIFAKSGFDKMRRYRPSNTTFLHEFIHGVMFSGMMRQMLDEGDIVALEDEISKKIGTKWKLPDGYHQGYTTSDIKGHEAVQSLVSSILIGWKLPGLNETTNDRLKKFRHEWLRGLSETLAVGNEYNISGNPIFQNVSPRLARVVQSLLSLSQEEAQRLYEINSDALVLAAVNEQSGIESLTNLNLVPLLSTGADVIRGIAKRKAEEDNLGVRELVRISQLRPKDLLVALSKDAELLGAYRKADEIMRRVAANNKMVDGIRKFNSAILAEQIDDPYIKDYVESMSRALKFEDTSKAALRSDTSIPEFFQDIIKIANENLEVSLAKRLTYSDIVSEARKNKRTFTEQIQHTLSMSTISVAVNKFMSDLGVTPYMSQYPEEIKMLLDGINNKGLEHLMKTIAHAIKYSDREESAEYIDELLSEIVAMVGEELNNIAGDMAISMTVHGRSPLGLRTGLEYAARAKTQRAIAETVAMDENGYPYDEQIDYPVSDDDGNMVENGLVADDAMQHLKDLLGAHLEIPLGSADKKAPTKIQAAVAAVKKLSIDKIISYIEPESYAAERFLLKAGETRSYFLLHNINGINEMAKNLLVSGVRKFRGSRWAGSLTETGESLATILDDMDRLGITNDVWAWLAAHRELEILRNHRMNKIKGYYDPDTNPNPETVSAARLVAAQLKGKYGFDGGEVADAARRIVKWQNATVLDPLVDLGMLTREEAETMRFSGEWYIPLRKATDRILSAPLMKKSFNDGTNSAIKGLRGDITYAEHPLQQMVSKALAISFLEATQSARQSVFDVLARAAGGSEKVLAETYGVHRITASKAFGAEKYADKVQITDPDRIKNIMAQEKLNKGRLGPGVVRGEIDGVTVYYDEMYDQPLTEAKYHDLARGRDFKTLTVWRDGEPAYYEVTDPEIWAMVDGIGPTHSVEFNNFAGKVLYGTLRFFARMKSALIVHNPLFVIGMFFKDLPTGFARSKTGISPFRDDIISAAFQSTAAIFPGLARMFPNSYKDWTARSYGLASQTALSADIKASLSPDEDITEASLRLADMMRGKSRQIRNRPKSKLKQVGMAIGSDYKTWNRKYQITKAEARANYNSKFLKMLQYGWSKSAGAGLNAIWMTLGGFTAAGDSVLRLAERRAGKRLEVTEGIKMQDLYLDHLDRNLTLDFSRKSRPLVFLNSVISFAAPGFQDFSMFLKNMRDPQQAPKYILKSLLAFTMPALINYLRWHDDDEWKQLPAWDKYNFMYFAKREGGLGFYRIPWGIGIPAVIFKDPIIAMLQYAKSKDPGILDDAILNSMQQSPAGFAAVPSRKVTKTQALISTLAPSAIDPFLDIAFNRDLQFNQNPIDVTAGDDQAGPKYGSPEDRNPERVGVLDRAATEVGMGLTPRQTSYLITRTFPGLGALSYIIANKLVTEKWQEAHPESSLGKEYRVPIKTLPFVSSPAYGTRSYAVQTFYGRSESLMTRWKDYRNVLERDADSANDLRMKYPELNKGLVGIFEETAGYIKEMQKLKNGWIKRQIQAGLPNDEVYMEAAQRFDVLITMRAQSALDIYNQVTYKATKDE